MSEQPTQPSMPPSVPPVTRRSFMFKLGLGLNVIAASLIAIPVLGFVLSAVVRRKAYQS